MSKSKGYSSYPDLQGHFNSWRAYIAAESTVGTPSILKEAIGAAGRGRAGLDQSPKQVPVKGEIVDTAFTEFVSKLQQISKRVIEEPINDEQLMQEVQAFLRAQGFVVQGMDVDAGKYANMAEDLSSGSMEYDKDSGSPMLGNLEEMVKNYKLFGSALVKACQSKYIKQITTSMERLGFGDVEKFLEQVAALTPAKEVAPENDLLKRLLVELVQAGTLDDYKAIWEKLREVLEKPDAASSEVLVTALKKIQAEAQTEAQIQEKLVELATHISDLEIKDEKFNSRAQDRFMKLAWKEYYADMSFEAAPEEEAEEAEEEEERPEEAPPEEKQAFDLSGALAALPKTIKVWEQLQKRNTKDKTWKTMWQTGTPTFKGDVEVLSDFIRDLESPEAAVKEGKSVFNKHVVGDARADSFFKQMLNLTVRKGTPKWISSPFGKNPELQKKAWASFKKLKSSDPMSYYSLARLTTAVFARFKKDEGASLGPNWKLRSAELLAVLEMIQGAKAAPSKEEPPVARDLAKETPPEGAENDLAEPKWDIPTQRKQVAEALDRWKTLAGIITESEEK